MKTRIIYDVGRTFFYSPEASFSYLPRGVPYYVPTFESCCTYFADQTRRSSRFVGTIGEVSRLLMGNLVSYTTV
jgi:hypothetical protein